MTSRHSRAVIVAACRRLMQAGRLRPTMRASFIRAGWSVRAFDTFHCIGSIAEAAHYERRLAEIETRTPEARTFYTTAEGRTP